MSSNFLKEKGKINKMLKIGMLFLFVLFTLVSRLIKVEVEKDFYIKSKVLTEYKNPGCLSLLFFLYTYLLLNFCLSFCFCSKEIDRKSI